MGNVNLNPSSYPPQTISSALTDFIHEVDLAKKSIDNADAFFRKKRMV